jgi:hypothetical protein
VIETDVPAGVGASPVEKSCTTSPGTNALNLLETLLGQATDAMNQLEGDLFGAPPYETEVIGYESPADALESLLEDLKETTTIVLDGAGMDATIASLNTAWDQFKAKEHGLKALIEDQEGQYAYSVPLTYMRRLIGGLRSCTEDGPTAGELKRLEEMLRRTHVLVHGRKVIPTKEHDVQHVMHDYLQAAFLGFTTDVRIPKRLKTFKPDCGVIDLGAAVEFKIVHDRNEVATAITGVVQDIGGYQGSKDWNRFYSVFYEALPFMSEAEAQRDIERSGGHRWTAIVVNGPAKRKRGKTGDGDLPTDRR